MRFTRSFQASPHCLPSPNGAYVATLSVSASTLHILSTEALSTIRDTSLPRDFTGCVTSLVWSPSGIVLLVASGDEIRVFSAGEEDGIHATIRNFLPHAAKIAHVGFGASDYHVSVCSSLGLKFAVFDIRSSNAVEIANPKFHSAASVRKGFCFRPHTRHLTLITRISGKDMISIHHPETTELQRSWCPETVDAQGIVWSPDGKWLVTWDSAAHGHKILFFTPDGNLFKTWSGPQPLVPVDAETKLGPGVRLLEFSADAKNLAICDSSRRICILNMATVTESLRLHHPNTIVPEDTLQVWQEQVSNSGHQFVRALQTISPPNRKSSTTISPSPGCVLISFDSSSALLATKLDDAPSTVWVWDVTAAELRAVLVFHGHVSRIQWNPTIRETLLVACDGDSYKSLIFLWDPVLEGPKVVDLSGRISNDTVQQALWLDVPNLEPAALFVSNNTEYILASLAEEETEPVPWFADCEVNGNEAAYEDEASELDDTFCFKK